MQGGFDYFHGDVDVGVRISILGARHDGVVIEVHARIYSIATYVGMKENNKV